MKDFIYCSTIYVLGLICISYVLRDMGWWKPTIDLIISLLASGWAVYSFIYFYKEEKDEE